VFCSVRFARECFAGFSFLLAMVSVNAQDLPWHLGSISSSTAAAPAAINTAATKPGPHEVVVAVIDGGVLPNHPSLSGRLLPGYDMLSVPWLGIHWG
jgi:patatin-like phospholipase/acyl hydrolase